MCFSYKANIRMGPLKNLLMHSNFPITSELSIIYYSLINKACLNKFIIEFESSSGFKQPHKRKSPSVNFYYTCYNYASRSNFLMLSMPPKKYILAGNPKSFGSRDKQFPDNRLNCFSKLIMN